MYITETTNDVKKLIEKLEKMDDCQIIKFLIYVFEGLYNNQINNLNEFNPSLIEDDDIVFFRLSLIGLSENLEFTLLSNLLNIYNRLYDKKAYESLGNIFGIDYTNLDMKLQSKYEKLLFVEKLDLLSEIFIRLGNFTLFKDQSNFINLDISEYEIAYLIQNFKNA